MPSVLALTILLLLSTPGQVVAPAPAADVALAPARYVALPPARYAALAPARYVAPAPAEDIATAVRLECFLLTAAPSDGAPPNAPAKELGLCAWRRSGAGDELQLELEISWFADALRGPLHRVLHVERLTAEGPRLVWREFGVGPGRCLLAEWTAGGTGLATVDWSTGERVRAAIDATEGAMFPLYLLELVRSGQAVAGTLPRFDPLSRSLEPVSVRTSYEGSEDAAAAELETHGAALRTVELVRADGSLATRCRFAGTELLAFAWQEDGARARRIPSAEYQRRLAAIAPAAAPEAP